ncbi:MULTISPECIES: trp operon leader peptide [unclassified Streptomyces]|uniref:trp operon leader peptide n=1 Tax=unclassified Streptomyces TaxID=2593676 RepID=UPI003807D231
MASSSVGHGRRAADAGHARHTVDADPLSTPRGRRKPACAAYGRHGRRGPSRAGQGRAAGRCGRVPGMFAHSTQNQNWWWTASPAAR